MFRSSPMRNLAAATDWKSRVARRWTGGFLIAVAIGCGGGPEPKPDGAGDSGAAGSSGVDPPIGSGGSHAFDAGAGPVFALHVVDVGTGLGLFVEGPDFALVYDAGSNDDRSTGGDNRFVAYYA